MKTPISLELLLIITTSVIKLKISEGEYLGIAEKATKQEGIARVAIGICGLHYHSNDPFLFHGF